MAIQKHLESNTDFRRARIQRPILRRGIPIDQGSGERFTLSHDRAGSSEQSVEDVAFELGRTERKIEDPIPRVPGQRPERALESSTSASQLHGQYIRAIPLNTLNERTGSSMDNQARSDRYLTGEDSRDMEDVFLGMKINEHVDDCSSSEGVTMASRVEQSTPDGADNTFNRHASTSPERQCSLKSYETAKNKWIKKLRIMRCKRRESRIRRERMMRRDREGRFNIYDEDG